METYKELHDTPVASMAVWGTGKVRIAANERTTPEGQYLYDCIVVDIDTSQGMPSQADLLEAARQLCLQQIAAYDQSAHVNTFYLHGKPRWLDRELRQSLAYSVKAWQASEGDTFDIWFGTQCESLPCDEALDMLTRLEIYAKQTQGTTARHRAEAASLTTMQQLIDYDFTQGYPNLLHFGDG